MIRRRAVSPSAGSRGWSAWVSPPLQRRAIGGPDDPRSDSCDAHEEPDGPAQGHALADEGGSEEGDEHRVLICLGEAPVA
jgi:hypothetical protein